MRRNATESDKDFDLTPKREQAKDLLFAGQTATATADSVGVHRSTVHRWMKEPNFIAALNQERIDAREARNARIGHLQDAALETVEVAVRDGDARLALNVLKCLGALNDSVTAIGPTDPSDVEQMQLQAERNRALLDSLML